MKTLLTTLLTGCALLCGQGCQSMSTVAGAIKCEKHAEPVIEYRSVCRETDPPHEKETPD